MRLFVLQKATVVSTNKRNDECDNEYAFQFLQGGT